MSLHRPFIFGKVMSHGLCLYEKDNCSFCMYRRFLYDTWIIGGSVLE